MEGKRLICNYNPKEAGEYQIKIMWNRDHIYGSPFIVFKADKSNNWLTVKGLNRLIWEILKYFMILKHVEKEKRYYYQNRRGLYFSFGTLLEDEI